MVWWVVGLGESGILRRGLAEVGIGLSMPAMTTSKARQAGDGHRGRLRARFLDGMGVGLGDHEILELALTLAIPRRDVKPLAKDMLARFGSLRGVIAADPKDLRAVPGVGEAVVVQLKLSLSLAKRVAVRELNGMPLLGDRLQLMDYLYIRFADADREEFVALFLDAKMQLIAAETMFTGTLDASVAAPRDIIKRALAHNAAGLIVAHNHPSGVPDPSPEDQKLTHMLADACAGMGITLHDHVIVGAERHYSFRGAGVLREV